MNAALTPTSAPIRESTLKLFAKYDFLRENDATHFFEQVAGSEAAPPLKCSIGLVFILVGGGVTVNTQVDGQPWSINAFIWGIGGGDAVVGGVLYTGYDSWQTVFNNTTSLFAEGGGVGGGGVVVTFFDADAHPTAQAIAAGTSEGAFGGGNAAKWKKS